MALGLKRRIAAAATAVTLLVGGGVGLALLSQSPTSPYTFQEEFNGTSLGSQFQSGWFGGVGPVNGSETACYSPNQVAVSGGYLHLTAIQSNECGKQFATGNVNTLNTFSFTTGSLEVRAYLPGDSTTIYNWPAVWTDGKGTWPATGESDIMEGLGGKAAYHYHSPSGGPGGAPSGNYSGWHTFGEVVIPGKVTYYYDQIAVGTVNDPEVGKDPHYIILGNQMGQYGGKQVTPTEMLVDYVHVSTNTNPPTSTLPTTTTTQPSTTTTISPPATSTTTTPTTVPTKTTYTVYACFNTQNQIEIKRTGLYKPTCAHPYDTTKTYQITPPW